MAVLYEICNRVNGKKYVGVTTTRLNQRWGVHLYKLRNGLNNLKMQDDFKLHGEAFDIKKIKEGDITDLLQEETFLTSTGDYEYNMIEGGNTVASMRQAYFYHNEKLQNSEEYRILFSQKVSSSLKGHFVSSETKGKIGLANKGKKRTKSFKAERSVKYSGEGNPNTVYFLNTGNGIYYSSKDMENLFGKCIGHIRKMFRENNPLLNNFVKC